MFVRTKPKSRDSSCVTLPKGTYCIQLFFASHKDVPSLQTTKSRCEAERTTPNSPARHLWNDSRAGRRCLPKRYAPLSPRGLVSQFMRMGHAMAWCTALRGALHWVRIPRCRNLTFFKSYDKSVRHIFQQTLDFWSSVFVAFVSSPPGDDEHNGEISSVEEVQ